MITTTLRYTDLKGEFHEESRDAETTIEAEVNKDEALDYVKANRFTLISCETTPTKQ